MSRQINTVIYTEKSTGKLLKRFDYPANKIPGKFFWEKMKLEELTKLLKARDMKDFEVKVVDYVGQNDREN
jgi:hypothetical protein